MLDVDPTTRIDAVLNCLQGKNVEGTVYATLMPPFASVLTDADSADIINHERSSWDNHGKQIAAIDVKERRAAGSAASRP